MNPGGHLVGGEAEWHGGKEVECRRALLPIIFGRMVHIEDAARDCIKNLEWFDELAGSEHCHADTVARCGRDCLAETLRAALQPRQALRPAGCHLELADALRDRRRWKACRRYCRCTP